MDHGWILVADLTRQRLDISRVNYFLADLSYLPPFLLIIGYVILNRFMLFLTLYGSPSVQR